MARERTYFKQISLFRARCIYVAHKTSAARPGRYMYILLRCSWRDFASSFWGRVSNLKGLKRFPRRVARRIVGPRTPIDRRLFRSFLPPALSRSPSRLIPFRLFSLLSPVPTVTYCELLTELCPPCPKKAVPFGATNFGRHEKWCGQPAMIRNTSRLVSS